KVVATKSVPTAAPAHILDPLIAAAEAGDAESQYKLGIKYDGLEDPESPDVDHTKAAFWSRKAAEQGHAEAQCLLCFCYDSGEGVDKDQSEAVAWYLKSAEQGDVSGQYFMGQCYQTGNGVDQDYLLAGPRLLRKLRLLIIDRV
ncbi:hypothetical protein HDU98_011854, partial [Podochytrium sp. JEL0797]